MSSKTNELVNIDDPYCLMQLETKINLMPHELCKNFEEFISNRLKEKVEGINSREGFIKPNSTVITRRSNGEFRGNHTTGQMTFHTEYIAEVCRPFRGDIVSAYVENINKNGLMARKGPLILIAHKDHENNSDFFNLGISLGSLIKFEIIGSKFQLYEDSIKAPCKILDILDENVLIDNNKKTVQFSNTDINNNFNNITIETNSKKDLNSEYGISNELESLIKKFNNSIEKKSHQFTINDINSISNKYDRINDNIYNINPISNSYFELYEVVEDLDLVNSINFQDSMVFSCLDDNDFSCSEFFLKYREKFNDNEKFLGDKLYVLNCNKKSIENKYISSLISEYGVDVTNLNLSSTKDINTYTNEHQKSDFIYCNGYVNKDNNFIENHTNLLASYFYYSLLNQKDNGHLVLRIDNVLNDSLYKLITLMGTFYNNIYLTRPNSVKDYLNFNYLVFKNYNYNKTNIEKFCSILNDILSIETKFYDKYDNNTKFITNLTNISLDKSFIREITSYNNNNVFQIMTKSYSKMINNINNYPDEEELLEIKLIQNKDAQKWVSKYMN